MTLLLVVHTPYQIQVFEFAKHRARQKLKPSSPNPEN